MNKCFPLYLECASLLTQLQIIPIHFFIKTKVKPAIYDKMSFIFIAFYRILNKILSFLWWFSGRVFTCQCKRCEFYTWVRKIPWRRKWQPTLVFLSGKSHEQRSLAGYSPWGCKRVENSFSTKQQQTKYAVGVRIEN